MEVSADLGSIQYVCNKKRIMWIKGCVKKGTKFTVKTQGRMARLYCVQFNKVPGFLSFGNLFEQTD